MTGKSERKTQFEPQSQDRQPGFEYLMEPRPEAEDPRWTSSGKLAGKLALITGGDSGIGRAVAILFAKEGADIVMVYFDEHQDAEETQERIEKEGRRCLALSGDIANEEFCREVVRRTVEEFGKIDILVNNAAVQWPQDSIEDISAEQLERTFRVNIFAMFHMTKACLPHMVAGCCAINNGSVTAYSGYEKLLDYSSSQGAVIAFTRSLARQLVVKGIRVNAVAPGPIWTPLIPATFPPEFVADFGGWVPMGRAGQPREVAPCFLFLACDDSSYMTGQVLHPNGGEIVNG